MLYNIWDVLFPVWLMTLTRGNKYVFHMIDCSRMTQRQLSMWNVMSGYLLCTFWIFTHDTASVQLYSFWHYVISMTMRNLYCWNIDMRKLMLQKKSINTPVVTIRSLILVILLSQLVVLCVLHVCAVGGVCHPQHTKTSSTSSTIAADSNNGATSTRCCRYSCLRSSWWVMVPLATCRAVSR